MGTALREFPAAYSLAIPRIAAPADGHRNPVRGLKTVRRPPIYPNGAQAISPVAPSPPENLALWPTRAMIGTGQTPKIQDGPFPSPALDTEEEEQAPQARG